MHVSQKDARNMWMEEDNISNISCYHHQCSAQGQVLHWKLRHQCCKFCPKAGLSLQTQEPRMQFYEGWIGAVASLCFPLLCAPHSFFSIWTNLQRSQKILGAPTRRCGEWIWLTGPSGLHRNSPQGLNISSIRVFYQIRDPEIPITIRPPPSHVIR